MSDQRRWTIYVCPECFTAFMARDEAETHAAVLCDPDSWPWTAVEVVPASRLAEETHG